MKHIWIILFKDLRMTFTTSVEQPRRSVFSRGARLFKACEMTTLMDIFEWMCNSFAPRKGIEEFKDWRYYET